MARKTLFDKIWESHVVQEISDKKDFDINAPQSITQLYIDRHFIHEVTSPQAFTGLREKGLKPFRPNQTFATADHNIPTTNQDKPIEDDSCRIPVETLGKNCSEFG
ncbi:MAG: 3-isopropylmalate dehydratase large subunit, partial [Bacteroidales bacterium]|nr:3-isopropylmalate dehydratase large subunit [Bacteroidales bacterium]